MLCQRNLILLLSICLRILSQQYVFALTHILPGFSTSKSLSTIVDRRQGQRQVAYSSPNNENYPQPETNTESLPSSGARTTPAEVGEHSYPIDLPSPLLLASSMVLAIVGTGSGFDLANDKPQFGFGITLSIATISLALSVGLFYASILKAKAETEADDKEYMKGK
jgi:hypothetical protein